MGSDEREVYRRERLRALDVLRAPVWIFDLDHGVKWWVNLAAVALWGASDREELLARTSSMSEATRTRLEVHRRRFERGETTQERWTFYPDGQAPLLAECTLSGVWIADGEDAAPRLAMLVEARPLAAWEVDPLERRSVEALRHVGEPVSLYTPEGAVLLRNPAAMRALGEPEAVPKDSDALGLSFVVPGEAALARAALDGEVRRFDVRLRTAEGERMHSVEARRTLDPVTGKEALLVCSRDVEERVVNEQRLERSRAQLAAQAEELERLAAPVLRVGSGVLVLPLIGRVDGARMEMALAALLPRIASDRARAVIFDLTGAMFVDAETADSLRRALGTLRLLGCGAVVAGVLPGLARLLVQADARLGARAYQTVEDALRGLSRE